MSEKTLVSEAMADLKRELANLENGRKELRKSLEAAKKAIKSDHSKELELRERMILLTKQEAKLNEKKERIGEKLGKLRNRLEKVSRISRELEGVE